MCVKAKQMNKKGVFFNKNWANVKTGSICVYCHLYCHSRTCCRQQEGTPHCPQPAVRNHGGHYMHTRVVIQYCLLNKLTIVYVFSSRNPAATSKASLLHIGAHTQLWPNALLLAHIMAKTSTFCSLLFIVLPKLISAKSCITRMDERVHIL